MTYNFDYKVHVTKSGVNVGDLTWDAERSSPNIIFDSSKPIKASLGGEFIVPEELDILRDELRPVLIRDGQEYPLGVFKAATAEISSRGFKGYRIEAYDRCWQVQLKVTENVLHLAAGTLYMTVIRNMLSEAGVVLMAADDCSDTLQSDREDWHIGTDYLSIINQLLGEIGFDQLWFDHMGVAQLRRYRPPDVNNIARHYSASDIARKPMAPDYTIQTDVFNSPNVFLCVCSNADNPLPLTAKAVNDSPISRKSVFNRGLRITHVEKVNQISGQEALQTLANRLRDESLMSSYITRISVLPEGGHLQGDTVSVDHPDIGGIYKEQGYIIKLRPDALMELQLLKEVFSSDGF